MEQVNRLITVPFKLVDANSVPLERTLDQLQVTFTLDGNPCFLPINFTDLGQGSYKISFIPTSIGLYDLAIYDADADLLYLEQDDVINAVTASDVVAVDHNYPTTDALRLIDPNPSAYTIYAYSSQAWQRGAQSPQSALGFTTLDSGGRWLSPIYLVPDTYHIVARDLRGNIIVMAVSLAVVSQESQ